MSGTFTPIATIHSSTSTRTSRMPITGIATD